MNNEELRAALTDLGVAEVARVAEVRPTTLYSFCSGDTRNLRSDTRDRVIAAISKMRGEPEASPGASEIVDLWAHKLDDLARREVLDFARFKANQKK